MQFSAALVAIFASVAFAQAPAMHSGAADAMPTGAPDMAGGAAPPMPTIPAGLAECVKKCAKSDDVKKAVACLKKECADVVSSLKSAAPTGAPGAAGGAPGAPGGAAGAAAGPM